MQVGIERDTGEPLPAALTAGLIFGVAAYFYGGGICFAIFMFYFAAAAGGGAYLAFLWRQLPPGAHDAARLALEFFRERYPSEPPTSVAVRAVEPERYIISVRYGFGMPDPRRYFAVPREGDGEITELRCSDWWPRGLK